jgi:hypothetical protein
MSISELACIQLSANKHGKTKDDTWLDLFPFFCSSLPQPLYKKKIVIVIAKYYMTIHLKPGFRYELQLRLRCAMYVTQLLKLEKKQKVKTISDTIQQAANRYRTFDRQLEICK